MIQIQLHALNVIIIEIAYLIVNYVILDIMNIVVIYVKNATIHVKYYYSIILILLVKINLILFKKI